MSDGVMTYEDWLRGCVHHDGRNGYVTLPCEEVLKIADFIERLRAEQTEPQRDYERGRQDAWDIAQKVFFSTVTLYEAEDVAKQIAKTEPQTERSE